MERERNRSYALMGGYGKVEGDKYIEREKERKRERKRERKSFRYGRAGEGAGLLSSSQIRSQV